MTSQDEAVSSQNNAETCQQIDPDLTQAGSPDVPDALAAMSTDLIAMSTRYGFDSPIGHACSKPARADRHPANLRPAGNAP